MSHLKANYNYPSNYRLGAGRVSELPELCLQRGIRRPLVVTDSTVCQLPWFGEVVASLNVALTSVSVFSDLRSNPVARDVSAGVAVCRREKCDAVVLLGGGAAMDVGKCVALMVNASGNLFDYEDVGDNWTKIDADRILPMIALPTTAGTGSEVGRASVIVNEQGEKKIIFHPRMQPTDVIADPLLTVGLPPGLTAYTGMDAFIHCFEAWCAVGFHPMADGIALEGMRLIASALPRALKDGTDVEARTSMLIASSMGATAFQKGLGVVHAISHALGGKLDVHHGLANAILLPYCMVFNRPAIDERCSVLARHLGLASPSFDGLLEWTLKRRDKWGIPHSLGSIENMSEEKAVELAPLALSDPALSGNPRPALLDDLSSILRCAYEGRLE